MKSGKGKRKRWTPPEAEKVDATEAEKVDATGAEKVDATEFG